MSNEVILRMRNVSKNFPGVVALDHVDFTLQKGQIHALMGENGAGKSTLVNVLTGAVEFQSGQIFLDGHSAPIVNKSPQDAQKNGISTVYQEINLCSNLSIAENLFMGHEPKKCGLIDWKTINAQSQQILDELEIKVSATDQLGNISIAMQQMVAIARAVKMSCKVLILDEPTSSLDDSEVDKLFELMKKLKNEGVGIIFITHFLEQVYRICDQITVLRNGQFVGEFEVEKLPRVQLVSEMLGKNLDDLASIKKVHTPNEQASNPFIEAKGLGRTGTIKPFNFEIRKGEVVGLTGLLGSGRSELVRTIYGAERPDTGDLFIQGKKEHIKAPINAMKKKLAYLPENRKEEGIIIDLSVRENIILALQSQKGVLRKLSKKEMERFADKYIEILQIKTPTRETPVRQLSGGNQQKVILGRWLLTNPELLILDEPTRGIDVGTKTEIQKLVIALAQEGKAVIFISSEIEEMLRTCSRLAVLRDGKKVGELTEPNLSQKAIMKAIAGGEENA